VIIRTRTLDDFEARLLRAPANHGAALRVFEALWEEARQLNVVPDRPGIEGLQHDVRYAHALHSLSVTRTPRP